MMPIRLTRAVKALLIACIAVFVLQLLTRFIDERVWSALTAFLALVPYAFLHELHLWQIFTYPFLHSDPLQLVLNLLMLVFIAPELEVVWGTSRFLRFYFFSTVFAGLCYLGFTRILGGLGFAPLMGAAGGIYALLVAYGILFGERVMLFMMLFPMKAKHFIWILAAVEFLSSLSYGRSGAGSVAALGGMAAGYVFLYGRATWNVFVRKRGQEWAMSRRGKRVHGAKHLKLVRPGKPGDKKDDPRTWH